MTYRNPLLLTFQGQLSLVVDTHRVPWTARRSNQSILKEVSPEYSLKGLMLKLQYFDHLMEDRTHWKRLMVGKFEGKRRRGR